MEMTGCQERGDPNMRIEVVPLGESDAVVCSSMGMRFSWQISSQRGRLVKNFSCSLLWDLTLAVSRARKPKRASGSWRASAPAAMFK